ncbi:D,D-heptose 1,7-bisphosphate phosphatase [Leptospira perolatii]|uniref:D,D-heptose 1,7-bisphosphate phosphatase n=1 Tax=Leptospira perolatii TaxID=2023191 RepID=A0A2M9ZLB8_9LEPT|nr:HAD family hydrolase [Leptospira perolatii]PJZ70287.1 D,D-heptose 1,7-bisphosphate phosphatase [Leptospira perolatii]PJZ72829.1 D,D-heptose 1,7-bisphosphate phosphatase [Leptospira perolatii]
MTSVHKKALFLDRDGVINIDKNYVYKQEEIEFVDGIFDLCRAAAQKGYFIFVITNQAGIGRGYYTERDFLILSKWMKGIFQNQGCSIEKFLYCPYHPIDGIGKYKVDSYYRKPNPGMLLRVRDRYGVDLEKSILVGDKMTDIEAGASCGVNLNLLLSDHNINIIYPNAKSIRSLSEVIGYLD